MRFSLFRCRFFGFLLRTSVLVHRLKLVPHSFYSICLSLSLSAVFMSCVFALFTILRNLFSFQIRFADDRCNLFALWLLIPYSTTLVFGLWCHSRRRQCWWWYRWCRPKPKDERKKWEERGIEANRSITAVQHTVSITNRKWIHTASWLREIIAR